MNRGQPSLARQAGGRRWQPCLMKEPCGRCPGGGSPAESVVVTRLALHRPIFAVHVRFWLVPSSGGSCRRRSCLSDSWRPNRRVGAAPGAARDADEPLRLLGRLAPQQIQLPQEVEQMVPLLARSVRHAARSPALVGQAFLNAVRSTKTRRENNQQASGRGGCGFCIGRFRDSFVVFHRCCEYGIPLLGRSVPS